MIIELVDLQRAIKVLEQAEHKMPYTFAGVGKYQHAETLTSVMNELGMRGEMSQEDLMYAFRNDVDKFTMRCIIDSLRAMGVVDTITRQGKEFYKYKPRSERI